MKTYIKIRGASEHNLKHVNVDIPRDELVVLTGLSGSGKSSLAFDTIYAEGQRRYMQSLSSYARQFLGQMDKPEVEMIEGLSPAISIDQKSTNRNPRSTVGTVTEIYDYLRLLYARIGIPHCRNAAVRSNVKPSMRSSIRSSRCPKALASSSWPRLFEARRVCTKKYFRVPESPATSVFASTAPCTTSPRIFSLIKTSAILSKLS